MFMSIPYFLRGSSREPQAILSQFSAKFCFKIIEWIYKKVDPENIDYELLLNGEKLSGSSYNRKRCFMYVIAMVESYLEHDHGQAEAEVCN